MAHTKDAYMPRECVLGKGRVSPFENAMATTASHHRRHPVASDYRSGGDAIYHTKMSGALPRDYISSGGGLPHGYPQKSTSGATLSRASGGHHSTGAGGGMGSAQRSYRQPSYASRPSEVGRQSSVLSERIVEHQVKVPKKVVREELVEKVMVVPERVVTEEVVNELQTVREKVVEVAKPIVKEKYVEVPDVVYIEKLVEVLEKVIQEKVKEVPRTEYRERVIEVPKIIQQERVVEIPEIQYREVPYEKVVEVPEIQEQVVVREVPVPQYVDKIITEYVPVEVPQNITRHVPVPIAVTTRFNYELPQPKPKYDNAYLNVYLPRFVEVPVPTEFLDEATVKQAQHYIEQVAQLAAHPAPCLRDVEELTAAIRSSGISNAMECSDYQSALRTAWKRGAIDIKDASIEAERGARKPTEVVSMSGQSAYSVPQDNSQTAPARKPHSTKEEQQKQHRRSKREDHRRSPQHKS